MAVSNSRLRCRCAFYSLLCRPVTAQRKEFWKRHPGLVWSNPEADDAVRISAALLRPRFGRLLDIAVEFELERLRREWQELQTEPTAEVQRASAAVERILSNIENGFSLAAARH